MGLAYSGQYTQPPLRARLRHLDDQLVDAGGGIRIQLMRQVPWIYEGAQHHTKPSGVAIGISQVGP